MTELLDTPAKAGKREPTSENWISSLNLISHGTQTHKLMQALKYSDEVEGLIEKMFHSKAEDVRGALGFIRDLDEPPMTKLIDQGHVEMGFAVVLDQNIVEGQIDLWGEVDGCVWFVDYKTGSTKYKEKAFKQLEYYALAMTKSDLIGAETPIRLAVIYPFSKAVYLKDYSRLNLVSSFEDPTDDNQANQKEKRRHPEAHLDSDI